MVQATARLAKIKACLGGIKPAADLLCFNPLLNGVLEKSCMMCHVSCLE